MTPLGEPMKKKLWERRRSRKEGERERERERDALSFNCFLVDVIAPLTPYILCFVAINFG